MGNCKVTILMSVYNGEKYLKEAVNSILNQTFTEFEFLIINDASTDKSMEILQSFDDSRIKIVSNEKNLGLTKSLNKGLNLATGEYIARMDADDISNPYRLEKQVYFLDMHPEIGLLGTQCQIIDSNSKNIKLLQVPTNDVQIRWKMLFQCSLAHPSVMIRRSVLLENELKYDEHFLVAQDYELWTRMQKYTKIANLNKLLLKYRIHSTNVSTGHKKKQLENRDIISYNILECQFHNLIRNYTDFKNLQYIYFSNRKSLLSLDTQRIYFVEKYLDILDIFINLHKEDGYLKILKHEEALKVAYLCLFFLPQPECIRIFRRLLLLDFWLPLPLLRTLFRAIYLKFKFLVK